MVVASSSVGIGKGAGGGWGEGPGSGVLVSAAMTVPSMAGILFMSCRYLHLYKLLPTCGVVMATTGSSPQLSVLMYDCLKCDYKHTHTHTHTYTHTHTHTHTHTVLKEASCLLLPKCFNSVYLFVLVVG